MKTLTLLILMLTIAFVSSTQNVNIPDVNFKIALIEEGVDTDEDGEISYTEAESITSYLEVNSRGISIMTGIEAFVNLQSLSCNNKKRIQDGCFRAAFQQVLTGYSRSWNAADRLIVLSSHLPADVPHRTPGTA